MYVYVGLRARLQVGRIKIEMEPRDRTRAHVNCRARAVCFILGMYTNMIQTARTIVTILQRWETIKITYYFFSRKLIGWFGVKWRSVLSRFSRTRKIPWALALESTTFQYLIVSNCYYILSIGFPYRGKSQMRIYVQCRGIHSSGDTYAGICLERAFTSLNLNEVWQTRRTVRADLHEDCSNIVTLDIWYIHILRGYVSSSIRVLI